MTTAPRLPNGQRVTYYNRAIETMPRDALRDYQWQRLQTLMARVFPANPFWVKKWRDAGFSGPRDIRGWDDFARLPFLTKQELVADHEAYPPYGSNLSAPLRRYVRFHQTSGTTGKPMICLDTRDTYDRYVRCWAMALRGNGIGPGDRVYFAFSFGPFYGFWGAFEATPRVGAIAIAGGGQSPLQRLATIANGDVTVLVCTPTYALRLAEEAAQNKVDLASSPIRKTVHAGEPGASIPATKKRLEELYGAESFDHAGMTEVGATTFECQAHPGGMHLIDSEFIFEVLDPTTGRPVPDGQEGELVLTNLGRWAVPVFRYRTGDRVRRDSSVCVCGRTFARLQGGILGRVDDMVVVRGVNVFPSAFEGILRRHSEVQEYQVEIRQERGMYELALKVELDRARVADPTSFLRSLENEIHVGLSLSVDTTLAPSGSLPRYEFKSRRFVFIT